MHKADVFFTLVISFLIGTFVASFALEKALTLYIYIAGIIVIAVAGYHRTFSNIRWRQIGLVLGVALLVFGFGVSRYQSFAFNHGILDTFAQRQAGGKGIPVILSGYVDEEPTVSVSGNQQIILRALSLASGDRELATDERTLLIVSPGPQYLVGQKLIANGSLEIPKNFADFDYVQYLKNKDIRTISFSPRLADNPDLEVGFKHRLKIGFYSSLFKIKRGFQEAISRAVPAPHAAYINGILLGSRQDIPEDLKDAFSKTGTTHVLAISGYNITVIANALLWVLVFFMRRRTAFWTSVGIIIAFTILTGAQASVVRAAIMGLLVLFASSYGRLYDPRNAISSAAGVMVLLQPSVLRYDIGFQLSFLAVLGLTYLYPILEEKTAGWRFRQPAKGLKEIFLMTVSAQIAVAPLILYYFQQLSLVSLLANILILPFMPAVMLFGFLAGIGGLLAQPLGVILGLSAWTISAYQLGVVSRLATLPFASVSFAISWITLAMLYALLIYGFRRWNCTVEAEPR